ncbi:hypothetical protein EON65_32260 [archaeon]|nr:MAG: hypothetical protein EON65_32260 [archaeon]
MTSALLFSILALLVLYSSSPFTLTSFPSIFSSLSSDSSQFDEQGRYILRDFDESKPFSSFLNGLAGIWGVPMWAFYVNRGQAISSFGKQNKDSAIAKFVTAEKAYQQTPFTGK